MADVKVTFASDTGQLTGDITDLRSDFLRLFESIQSEVKDMSSTVKREMSEVAQSMKSVKNEGAGLSSSFGNIKSLLAGIAGYKVADGLKEGIKYIVSTTAEFERLRTVLVTMEGSNAQARFDEIKQFAKETPFDLAQVVTGFTKLKARGLDPSMDALRSYGNTASSMGKSLDQMIEAVADASVGEFERMKEFGVKAKQQGDSVTFSFNGVTKTVKRNSKEIEGYLQDIGNTNFAGAMEDQMKTLGGVFSNLGDMVATTADQIGSGGLSDAIKEVVDDMMSATGGTEEWAGALGQTLGVILVSVWQLVQSFGDIVSTVFEILGDVISVFTGDFKEGGATWMDVLKAVLITFNGFAVGVRVAIQAVMGIIRSAGDVMVGFADVVRKAFNFDFAGAYSAFKVMSSKVVSEYKGTVANVLDTLSKGKARQDEIVRGKKTEALGAGRTGVGSASGAGSNFGNAGAGKKGPKGSANGRVSEWKTELDEMLRTEAGFFKDSTQMELDFWQQKLALTKSGTKERAAVEKEVFNLQRSLAKENLSRQIEDIDSKQAALRGDLEAQIALEDQKLDIFAQNYGKDSDEYRRALRSKEQMSREYQQKLLNLERERVEHQAVLHQNELETDRDIASIKYQMQKDALQDAVDFGLITDKERLASTSALLQQELDAQMAHENAIYTIKANAVREQLELNNLLEDDRRNLMTALVDIEAEHNNKMREMKTQASAEWQQMNADIVRNTQQTWNDALTPLAQSFDSMINSMLYSSMSFRDAFISVLDTLFQQFVTQTIQMAQKWLVTEMTKTSATTAGTATRTAVEVAGAATATTATVAAEGTKTAVTVAGAAARTAAEATAASTGTALSLGAAVSQVAHKAVVAAAGAYAAIASIPVVGPFLAPVAAAAALYGVYSLAKGLFSAKDGEGEVPYDGAMYRLHAKEMVLPAKYANPLRDILSGPSRGGLQYSAATAANDTRSSITNSGGNSNEFNYSPSISGGNRSLESMLESEGRAMRAWFSNQVRNGSLKLG